MSTAALDTLNRRSRLVRTHRSPSLRLSDRDISILLALTRYRYLSSTQIHSLAGGNATTLKWRLRDLFDAEVLHRPQSQWEVANALCKPVVYELSTKGYERLQELDLISPHIARRRSVANGHYWHTLFVSQIMASFEIGARDHGLGLIAEGEVLERLALTENEHLNPRALPVGNGFLLPDGLFGLRTPAGVTLYALEVDRGQEPLTRRGTGSDYRQKVELYGRLVGEGIYKKLLSTPAPLVVLHVTTSKVRMRGMMRLAQADTFHLFKSILTIGGISNPVGPIRELAAGTWTRFDGSEIPLMSPLTGDEETGEPTPDASVRP